MSRYLALAPINPPFAGEIWVRYLCNEQRCRSGKVITRAVFVPENSGKNWQRSGTCRSTPIWLVSIIAAVWIVRGEGLDAHSSLRIAHLNQPAFTSQSTAIC
jgi:hypothetical protein